MARSLSRLAAILVPLLAACPPEDGPPSCRGGVQVCRGAIRDADGRTMILRGVNLSDRQKRPPYLDFHGPADYQRLRGLGLNAVRFVMTWAAIEPTRGTYDDAYLDAVAERLGWASQAGLAVILDMHQDLYGEGFGGDGAPRWACDEARYAAFTPRSQWFLNYADPNLIACLDAFYAAGEQRTHFVAAWGHAAARLAGAPAVVGFDILNEPFWASTPLPDFEPTVLASLYVDVATVVRASAPGWLVFAEPSAAHNLGLGTHLPLLPLHDVVYAPHAYDPSAESGEGFDPARRAAFTADVALMRSEADALGAALWIGEYGAPAGTSGLAAYLGATYDGAGQAAASTMYWDYGRGGYGLLAADGTEVAALVELVTRPYPARVAGDLVSYAYDEAARALTVRYLPDRSVSKPTELVVPARVYPDGVAVSCGGCSTEAADGVVRLLSPPPGAGEITVTVGPR